MKQLINKFLKEQGYSKGQIYKVCPNVLLEDFSNFMIKETNKSLNKGSKTMKKFKNVPDFLYLNQAGLYKEIVLNINK